MKKYCVSRSLSNMSKNGLRMVVHLNFDITHLSPPSSKEMIDNNFNDNQLEKLEAAITFPYLFLTFLTFPYLFLPFLTFPYLSLPILTYPYLSLPILTCPYLPLPFLQTFELVEREC